MKKLALLVASVAVAVATGTVTSGAIVVGQTTLYVDPENGTDIGNTTCGQSGPGSSTGPCATLNTALANAASGASIFIERGGVFGPIYITAPVAINGPADQDVVIAFQSSTAPGCVGAAAGTCGLSTANYAVEIAAGTSDTVKLKNVIVNNGPGTNGAMRIASAFNVSLKNVVLRGGSGTIPQMLLIDSAQGSLLQFYMNNGDIGFSSTGGGIYIHPSGGTPIAAHMVGAEVHNAMFGIKVDSTAVTAGVTLAADVNNCEFFAFNNAAVTALATSGGNSHLLLARSNILDAGAGALNANGAGAVMIIYEDTITSTSVGVKIVNGATVFTLGNNEIFGNGTNVLGSLTPTPLQ